MFIVNKVNSIIEEHQTKPLKSISSWFYTVLKIASYIISLIIPIMFFTAKLPIHLCLKLFTTNPHPLTVTDPSRTPYHPAWVQQLEGLSYSTNCKNSPYITSNEASKDAQEILEGEKIPGSSNNIFIGTSGWGNYDLIAQSPDDFCGAIIIDINEDIKRLHQITKNCALSSETPSEFLIKFQKNIKQEFGSTHCGCENAFWLSSQNSFLKIRKLFMENSVVSLSMNICDRERVAKIGSVLENNHLCCRLFYLSNIGDWIPNQESLLNSIKPLISDHTIIIEAYPRSPNTRPLYRYLYKGTEFIKKNFKALQKPR